MNKPIQKRLAIPGNAGAKWEDIARHEEWRTIGGNLGDLTFDGYSIETNDEGEEETVLYNPVLSTKMEVDQERAARRDAPQILSL